MNPDTEASLLAQAVAIWLSGGWGMIALAFNGIVIYGMGLTILFKLASRGVFLSPDRAWNTYHEDPDRPRGAIGRIIDGAVQCDALEEVGHYFEELRNEELHPFERDLRVMKVAVSAAPLLGLLGTVTGMLATFAALATGGGGDQTMDMVAGGISEALITTETGLVLALSGLIFQFVLTRQHQHFGEVVAHLETLSMQRVRPPVGADLRGGAPAHA